LPVWDYRSASVALIFILCPSDPIVDGTGKTVAI
jgi:hypothetical protein